MEENICNLNGNDRKINGVNFSEQLKITLFYWLNENFKLKK